MTRITLRFIWATMLKYHSLFDMNNATFQNDKGARNQKDAEGFIKLNALRLRIAGKKGDNFMG